MCRNSNCEMGVKIRLLIETFFMRCQCEISSGSVVSLNQNNLRTQVHERIMKVFKPLNEKLPKLI